MKQKSSFILSLMASLCFLIAYFLHKETTSLILGITWICISIGCFFNMKKPK